MFTAVGFRAAPPQAASRTFFRLPWLLLCGTGGEGQGQGRELRDGRLRRGPSPLLPAPEGVGGWKEDVCFHDTIREAAVRHSDGLARPRHWEMLAQHFCILVNFHNL